MKTKVIILIAISAVVTLSFTFISATRNTVSSKAEVHNNTANKAPVGGFVSEE